MATSPVIQFPSLYEITDHVSALFDSLDGADMPELRAQIESDLMLWIESEARKVDNIAEYLAHCEERAQFADDEILRLERRRDAFEHRAERLKGYVIRVMECAGKTKLEGRTATLALRKCPATVEVVDESALPDAFVITKTTTAPDKRAIKAALDAGAAVPGAELRPGRMTLRRS